MGGLVEAVAGDDAIVGGDAIILGRSQCSDVMRDESDFLQPVPPVTPTPTPTVIRQKALI